jgi:hypothetical protein
MCNSSHKRPPAPLNLVNYHAPTQRKRQMLEMVLFDPTIPLADWLAQTFPGTAPVE